MWEDEKEKMEEKVAVGKDEFGGGRRRRRIRS